MTTEKQECPNDAAVLRAALSEVWTEPLRAHQLDCESCRLTVRLVTTARTIKERDEFVLPPLERLMARAEYEREKRYRRQFAAMSHLFRALAVLALVPVGVLAPGEFPLSTSETLTPVIVGLVIVVWWVTSADFFPQRA